jgi:hypothetical protein
MPELIEHIDAIARQQKRDVLFLEFPRQPGSRSRDYELLESRREIVQWLDAMAIQWQSCGDIASETCFRSYEGGIYLDVVFDVSDPTYQKLQCFLEYPDGRMRFVDVRFYVLSLARAMQNAHHDEPGFWERIADNF